MSANYKAKKSIDEIELHEIPQNPQKPQKIPNGFIKSASHEDRHDNLNPHQLQNPQSHDNEGFIDENEKSIDENLNFIDGNQPSTSYQQNEDSKVIDEKNFIDKNFINKSELQATVKNSKNNKVVISKFNEYKGKQPNGHIRNLQSRSNSVQTDRIFERPRRAQSAVAKVDKQVQHSKPIKSNRVSLLFYNI